ncbi:LOW QUALITY PROTEIN: uncharacterized protein EMH_0041030 [Eimeria mitis]|uniref:Uncharacterized protein n=1 Tax=Eimeria mitis TaxID=44415 RepID=U6JSS0_9EIME|nr:LOW QUALITY PROTEIN: uncharacterized protein EMH_0041030 [Eimeria mitis]CDJ28459.1 hypothetical protein EMH_0041030 [Eimeria mitis]
MKDESLKLIGAAPALAEVPTNVMPATTSATPAAVAEAATAEPDPGCGDVTVSLTGAECSSRQSCRSSSLLQFASATKVQQKHAFCKDPPAAAVRRDLVTKTRFAHRTKLVSTAECSAPPFFSLKSLLTARSSFLLPNAPPLHSFLLNRLQQQQQRQPDTPQHPQSNGH